jgi:hypothetical protein
MDKGPKENESYKMTTLFQFVPTIFNNLNKIWKHFSNSKFEIGTKLH